MSNILLLVVCCTLAYSGVFEYKILILRTVARYGDSVVVVDDVVDVGLVVVGTAVVNVVLEIVGTIVVVVVVVELVVLVGVDKLEEMEPMVLLVL